MTSLNREMIECPFEAEVLDALAAARWPARVNAELTSHVASCEICRDVITVAQAMSTDHDAAWREANVPSSGQMWWRAEMRTRQDAIRDASRPVAVAQGVAVLLGLGVIGAGVWFAWPSIEEVLATPPPMFIPIAIAMIALVMVVAPLALYFVLSDQTD
jgi:hypothetical protein